MIRLLIGPSLSSVVLEGLAKLLDTLTWILRFPSSWFDGAEKKYSKFYPPFPPALWIFAELNFTQCEIEHDKLG